MCFCPLVHVFGISKAALSGKFGFDVLSVKKAVRVNLQRRQRLASLMSAMATNSATSIAISA